MDYNIHTNNKMTEAICLPQQEPLGEPIEFFREADKPIQVRDWSLYIKARQREKQLSLQLLSEAIRMLNVKTYCCQNGRPPFPLKDKLFLCIQKVLRGATYDSNEEFIEYAKLKGFIQSQPRPHSLCDYMNDAQLIPLLEQLVILTSTPLTEFEKKFAIDSTGLSTSNRNKWVKVRLDHRQHRNYRKIHTIVGVNTNVIVSARVTVGTQGDSPLLIPLLDNMSKYFNINELSADKAYCSRKNAQAVQDKGAVPYFDLKKNLRTLSLGYPAWKQMIYRFKHHEELYKRKYHLRSNVESTYSMFKRKVSGYLRSKNNIAQTNEALCIAVVHNLFVLVNAVFCNDLEIEFRR